MGYTRDIILVWTGVLIAAGLVALIVVADGRNGGQRPAAIPTTPRAETAPTPPAGGASTAEIKMVPSIRFDADEMTLPADTEVTVRADNQDTAIQHNWAVYTDSSAEEVIAKTEICPAPCVEEVTFTTPPPGEYFFRCDVHPKQMTGKLIVSGGQ